MDAVKELLAIDWKEVGIKLAGYAAFRARNLSWRTGSGVALAKGLMPDDVAAQAILSVISGDRTWEPERGPLLPFLKRVVDSLLNHLAESSDNRRVEGIASSIDGIEAADRAEDSEDEDQRRVQMLIETVEDKPELMEVLRAIIDFDEARPRFIAARIGKPVAHVNNCLKRLRRLALKISSARVTDSRPGGAMTYESR